MTVTHKQKIIRNLFYYWFLLLCSLMPTQVTAKIYGINWKILRVIDAGTLEFLVPELPESSNKIIVHLIIDPTLKLPRFSEIHADLPGYCSHERNRANQAKVYAQKLISQAKDIYFTNPTSLSKVLQLETRELYADVLIDGQSLAELLKKQGFLKNYWCL